MANSSITRNKVPVRPSFNFPEDTNYIAVQAQMLESIRNVLEGIADAQMLQCNVRRDIRRIRLALEKIAQAARRRAARPAREARREAQRKSATTSRKRGGLHD